MTPKPLNTRPNTRPNVIFTDVDDTLTWQGRLPLDTFRALYQLKQANINVVPVTGGSAGWCDCIIRTWPIDYMVGENGSFYLCRSKQGRVSRHFLLPDNKRLENTQRLQQVATEFKTQFPNIPKAPDQDFRLTDLAFDIAQEANITNSEAEQAVSWLQAQGIAARKSSIHINAWLGSYDKAIGAKAWLTEQTHFTLDDCLFIGDSANDEAMFKAFLDSVGVANIQPILPSLSTPPTYITNEKGGFGFAELAKYILGE